MISTTAKCALLSTLCLSFQVFADTRTDDPRIQQLKEIYPYRPYATQDIVTRVKRFSEDPHALINVFEITNRGLNAGQAKDQPWNGSFWPLIQGQIANPYQSRSFFEPWEFFQWKGNAAEFKKRREKELSRPYDLSEAELAQLAPSEKYDLALGDTNFDLTNRIWNFVDTWGNNKSWGYVTSIDMPAGYRFPQPKDNIALWEGICHGWALAAGGFPRPEHTVDVILPNGKRLAFYPTDIKALVSLTVANSTVQDAVLMEGGRCNEMNPPTDEWGRYTDVVPKQKTAPVAPDCADVHPAVWHLSLANLMGQQGRAFVAEMDANGKVNNLPAQGYKFTYFNPDTGRAYREKDIQKAIMPIAKYKYDPYAANRNPEAVSVIGVETQLTLVNWVMPSAAETDGPENDKLTRKTMRYDLELDASGNVVGGQWRTDRVPVSKRERNGSTLHRSIPATGQPDFFWTLPKNYMNYFKPVARIGDWDPYSGQTPPAGWIPAARNAHSFVYQVTRNFGFNEQCTVVNDTTKDVIEVPCEYKYARPQPLLNLVNKLLDESRR